MMMNKKLIWTLLIGMSTLLVQCKESEDELVPDDENELITSVTLNFKEASTGTVTSFSYKDTDGDGGNAPTKFDTVALKANT